MQCDIMCRWVPIRSNLTRPQTTRTRNKPRAGRQSRAVYLYYNIITVITIIIYSRRCMYTVKNIDRAISRYSGRGRVITHRQPPHTAHPHYITHTHKRVYLRVTGMYVRVFCFRGSRPQNVYGHRYTIYACIFY